MSHVAMGKHVCPVCGRVEESGEVLLHKQLRDIPEDRTVTGYGLCKEHQELADQGYVALVEADPEKSGNPDDVLKIENAYRTGVIAHIRREVAKDLFNTEIPDDLDMMFIDPDAMTKIREMMPGGDV